MAGHTTPLETGHEAGVTEAAVDYYGKRLATASSDRSIKIFDIISEGKHVQTAHLRNAHDGPIFGVAWSNPRFGPILASCSYDGRVILWKEQGGPVPWIKVFEDNIGATAGGINSLGWAPHTLGPLLATAAADGYVSVYEYRGDSWTRSSTLAHKGGCSAVSWAGERASVGVPVAVAAAGGAGIEGKAETRPTVVRRFVTSGWDNRIRIWRFVEAEGKYVDQKVFAGHDNLHADCVRDVAWSPTAPLIASASEDKTVVLWSEDASGLWRKAKILRFEHKVWRVSWSPMGDLLAVAQGNNKVTLWKQAADGEWRALPSGGAAGAGGAESPPSISPAPSPSHSASSSSSSSSSSPPPSSFAGERKTDGGSPLPLPPRQPSPSPYPARSITPSSSAAPAAATPGAAPYTGPRGI